DRLPHMEFRKDTVNVVLADSFEGLIVGLFNSIEERLTKRIRVGTPKKVEPHPHPLLRSPEPPDPESRLSCFSASWPRDITLLALLASGSGVHGARCRRHAGRCALFGLRHTNWPRGQLIVDSTDNGVDSVGSAPAAYRARSPHSRARPDEDLSPLR